MAPIEVPTDQRRTPMWNAFWKGIADGFAQPFDLTTGMTYTSGRLNKVYDHGANIGQFLGRLLNRRAE